MTDGQKEQISELRAKGLGYKKIATELSVSIDTIKSYCRRNGLVGEREKPSITVDDTNCRECGKELTQIPKTKRRSFCCDICRIRWWSAHPGAIKQKAVYSFVCPTCGKKFLSYGNSKRKYCSHDCYIRSRFQGGEKHD